jgi:hypothetical protein
VLWGHLARPQMTVSITLVDNVDHNR